MKRNYSDIKSLIKESIAVHGNKYDYSLLYSSKNGRHTKSKIICPVHGIFEQSIYMHIVRKQGCPKCSGLNKTTNELINTFKKIHGNKYNYSLVKYRNSKTKIQIICPVHGVFEQLPHSHSKGFGCAKCADCHVGDSENFIKNANKIHNNKYDYSKTLYKNAKTKLVIKCPEHGIFKQTPNKHLQGKGCPKCNTSKAEILIENYLIENKIKYITQHSFKNCKYKRPLKFDFYLPKHNMCIEFDGEQHFKKYRFEKNDERLNIRKKRDNIKTNYCKNNKIKLLRIKYDEKIINKLNETFNI